MANDANVQRVDELAEYSRYLYGFIESMTNNFSSFNNVMMQKLEQLSIKLKQAIEIESEAIRECTKCEKDYAYCPSSDVEGRRRLMVLFEDAQHKKMAACRMKSIVQNEYGVAESAVRCMLDSTKIVQNKLQNDIDRGRQFLKKAAIHLKGYKDNTTKR